MTPLPGHEPLADSFGRIADDLRVSLTDRCNLRCTYCMPAEGMPWFARDRVLGADEIVRLVGIFAGMGVRSVKLTGGEPTVRSGVVEITRRIRAVLPGGDLSMTTNGLLLEGLAAPLASAGLDRVTVSCDSLMRHRYAEMTRRDALDRVMAGIHAALEAGLEPVKVNCVLVRGTNEAEALPFARLARRLGVAVRFIEYMPLDAGREWESSKVVPSAGVLEAVGEEFGLVASGEDRQPARTFVFADGAPGSIGVVSSVTAPFCATCNRVRLTADGTLRNCLFAAGETNLRDALRGGAPDEELAGMIRAAVGSKAAGHLIGRPGFVRPERSMSQIGG